VDIDLFTDVPYGSIDFKKIDEFIDNTFPFHDHSSGLNPAMGKSYTIGIDKGHAIKLDVFYTDLFIQPALLVDAIRLTTIEEIIAKSITANKLSANIPISDWWFRCWIDRHSIDF